MSADWLDQPVTTAAYAWRLERSDGVTLGFISHDRDICIDGLCYRAAPGMIPSTITASDGLEIDSAEIAGALTSDAISAADLAAGRWNGARLNISLVNWQQPDAPSVPLLSGEFGEIIRAGDSFQVEMLGATSFLDQAIAPLTSPTCRAEFGDKQCKLSLHRYQLAAIVTNVDDSGGIAFAALAGQAAQYRAGHIRFTSGPNCGLRYMIIDGADDLIHLADQPASPVALGDRALLTQGCDKNFATCRRRFANSLNFRGEPHLPGNDLLTRYPGA